MQVVRHHAVVDELDVIAIDGFLDHGHGGVSVVAVDRECLGVGRPLRDVIHGLRGKDERRSTSHRTSVDERLSHLAALR